MPASRTLVLGLLALMAVSACTQRIDPSVVEALTAGAWHAEIGEDDYLYEFSFENGDLGGSVHRVNDGRQINEIPLTEVSLDGTSIKIGHGRFPPYLGEADLQGGRIVGGVPRERQFREMNLTRVERSEWPMIRPRAEPTAVNGADVWVRPAERADGWQVAAPSEVGLDPAAVDATIRAILEGEAAALHSFLVVRDGRLVIEEYFYGWDRDDLHELLSCTKSVASLLVGIAIDQGSLEGVDVPVLGFFPQHRRMAGRGWEDVRLEHLLTMTMGLDWASDEIGSAPAPRVDRFVSVLDHEVADPPGSRFQYAGRGVDLLSGILLEATGMEADRFADAHLFAPLGIDEWDWNERRWQDHPDLSAALKLRPRDMARLGQLVLDEGLWHGQQVVSAEWIRASTGTHVAETGLGPQYGYLWWRLDPAPPDMPLGSLTFANGIGSQFIVVSPDARLVVVTTGGNPHNGRQFDIMRVAERHLLPGVR